MKKALMALLAITVLTANVAVADILPEGEKQVSICSFFGNIDEFLDEFAVFVQEAYVTDETAPTYRLVDDSCFTTSYKFNNLYVYGLSIEFLGLIDDIDEYDPREDENAHLTNISTHRGVTYFPEDSNVSQIKYEYEILGLDEEKGKLIIELLGRHTYYNDDTEATFTPVEKEEVVDPEETEEVDNIFLDVGKNSVYFDALSYLKEEGIVHGYADGTFKPEKTINRAEFTKIIIESTFEADEIESCLEELMNEESEKVELFSDVVHEIGEEMPIWYFNYVCVAKTKNIISGYPDGSFKPSSDINFVEAAKIITRSRGMDEEETASPWFRNYVEELVEKFAIPTSIRGFGQKLSRGEMAELIYRLDNEIVDKESQSYIDLE